MMVDETPGEALTHSPLRMELHFHPSCLGHDTGSHPENQRRLEAFNHLPAAPPHLGEPYLSLVHAPDYIAQVKAFSASATAIDGDTRLSVGSYLAATYAVGATVQAAETNGFALVRPPGHHAYAAHGSGFCLFNSVAVAAQYLVNQGKRVLILDFDGHLGDGTSAIFYHTDQVMYWSLHQYPAFPGHGFVEEIGVGAGLGFNLNAPLPPGAADDIFLDAFDHFLAIAEQFAPDVVAVSAGFDANQFDPLLELRVSNYSYYRIGQVLAQKFPRIFATLEGGYNIQELVKGINSFVAGINGAPFPYEETRTVSGLRVWETYEIYLHGALGKLKNYWRM